MSKCQACGASIDDVREGCPQCGGTAFSDAGSEGRIPKHKPNDEPRRLVTDGGRNAGGVELGAVVIGIVSILYFLMNLLGTLAYIGLTGASSSLGDSGGALFGVVAIVVSLALTIGFLAGPIGVFTESAWGWAVTAGVWALNLVWGLLMLVINGFNIDILNIVFLAINLAILGYVYTNKMDDVTTGTGAVPA